MSSKTRRPSPSLNLVQSPQDSGAPGNSAAASDTRSDGTPDWSIYMARAQDGDGEAYRRLLEEIVPYLRALAIRRIGNRSDAEDTVQDILLTIHTVRHTYDPTRPFGPWLVAIASRRIIDGLRRQGRHNAHEAPLDQEYETLSTHEANLQEEATDAGMLRAAVARLPVGQRNAIQMLKLEEMSLKEAAASSGMSVAALKTATHRALKSLRKMIDKRGGKP
ncbi:RNA polymerase, sigma subunit, ECF family [Collimonas sp. OK242]|uniref:sigma-70 family RNA polymerase sigma factor n=1 Tax=Collimonas sp. OK242 TaxID=1798195 RepID=UPI00089B61B2|nr:sigma-70 family RNA polymerase sigma factor [Collimonas sp. OK242]SDX75570.1 RNA polymerase, sigma subunit, ECF family [Collimonas sp. OK242]